MKIHYFIIFGVIFFLVGCKEKADQKMIINSNSTAIASFPETNNYTFTKLADYIEGTPYKFYEVDSGLFLLDIDSKENIFYFFDYQSQKFTNSFIGKGNGPNESFSPFSSGIMDGKLWVLDFTMHKVVFYDLSKTKDNEYELKLPYYFNHIEMVNENVIIGNVLSGSKYKFQKLNRQTGEYLSEFGEFENMPDSFNDELLHKYFQSIFAIRSDEKKMVSAYRWHDAIEIFNLETLESLLIKGPWDINNDFGLVVDETGNLILNRDGDMIQCNKNISVTDSFIYTLFSGIADSVIDSFYCNTVLVYDWEGNPVKKINLDRKVMSFSVSPDDSRIYSFDVNTGEVIYVDINID